MSKPFIAAAALATLLTTAFAAAAQDKGVIVAGEAEAIVKIVAIDRKARNVTFRGPQGNEVIMDVPKEAQNFDKVKVGDSFKMRYAEAMAVGIKKGGEPTAQEARDVKLAPKGGTPGGTVVQTKQVSAKVESIALATRTVAVRGPKGKVTELKVSDEVKDLDKLAVGDVIHIVYTQALALEMVPVEKTPATKK